jgi:flagellar motor switch protein FliN/FliY
MAEDQNTNPPAEGTPSDEWAAAMAEQQSTADNAPSAADEWANALAEQQQSPAAEAPAAAAEDDWSAAMAEEAAAKSAAAPAAPAAQPQQANIFPTFNEPENVSGVVNQLDMILDIPVQITVELGRTKITIKNLLQLAHGSVVELDALAGEPMDVLVNGTLIAQGEVVVVNDKFGIRLTDIITPSERMRKLGR